MFQIKTIMRIIKIHQPLWTPAISDRVVLFSMKSVSDEHYLQNNLHLNATSKINVCFILQGQQDNILQYPKPLS